MPVGRSPELDELFRPASIAVVGASNRPGTVGTTLFRNIIAAGFQGTVYPVNPTWKSVSAVRCYPDVAALPETPDLGIVIVPAARVPTVIDQLGRAGARGAIVISAGFREVGEAGAALEADLINRAAGYRMSLVGPNCFGVINTDPAVALNATFSASLPPSGSIALVSQSGALGAGILQYGIAERIGFSRFVSVGNRAGVDENDLLLALGRDPATRVILLYVESLADGRRFLETAREVTERKPVLVIKSGRTPAGERAVRSHTGSLAQSGRDQLYDALFEQAGVIRAETLGDLFRYAKIFGAGLRLEGPRLVILTNSGGPGIVAADAAVRHGLEIPPLPPAVAASLASQLPSIAAVANPLDMTAGVGGDTYRTMLGALLAAPEIDGVFVIATPTGTMTGDVVARAIVEGRGASTKPIVACMFGLTDLSNEVTYLEEHGIPTFSFPEEGVGGIAGLARYLAWRTRPRTEIRSFDVDRGAARATIASALASGLHVLPEYMARSILTAYGIRFPPATLARSVDEAVAFADRVGYPVVLKVASPDISHKTDVGGVALHLADGPAVREAWTRLARAVAAAAPQARIEGFDVESEILGGKEVLVGLQRDDSFGPVLVFGTGGIYVEVLKDVTFRLAPIRTLSARHMIQAVRAYPILTGVRGEPPADLAALEEVLERISQLAVELPEIAELDVNPLLVRPAGEGAVAVDARIVLGSPSRSAPTASPPR